MKTGIQVQNDIINLLRGSSLANSLSGGLYRGGMRPRDSRLEDIVVTFTTANGNQVQEGVVTINIFVPDIAIARDGILYQDSARCEAVETMAQDELDTWNGTTEYHFTLRNTIFTLHDDDIHESFVVIRLGFKCLNY